MTFALPERPESRRGSDYAELSRRVAAAGLMARRRGWYAVTATIVAALFVSGWAVVIAVGDSWWQLAMAAIMAVVTTQVAFLGHDAGHRQISSSRRLSEIAGLLAGNLAVGLSYGWWIDKHNRHHANPNHTEHDPDVGAGVLVWTEEQAAQTRGAGRWLARRQAYLFFPLLLLEGPALRVASIRAVWGREPGTSARPGRYRTPMRHRRVEGLLLLVNALGYLGLLYTLLPPAKMVLFIAVHQGLWGLYMGCAFAPNHKGMPVLTAGDQLDFLRKQVLTSRNVRGGRVVDLALGGLNYQIEHHLFPSMPRANLRRAQPLVRAYCAERGIPYEETGLLDSYRQALRHLRAVGAPARMPAADAAPSSRAGGATG